MDQQQPIERRAFVGAAVAAGTVVLGSQLSAFASEDTATQTDGQKPVHKQVGFWVNTRNCVDCGTCAHACRRANNTPEDEQCRRQILVCRRKTGGTAYVSVSCMHCSDPLCVKVCPAGAIIKRSEDGVVYVNSKRCIGCRYCFQACPFGVPHYTSHGMDKCDCCLGNGRYPDGLPACVEACPHDALHFGEIRSLIEEAGDNAIAVTGITGPSLVVS